MTTLGKDFRLPPEIKPKSYDADLRIDMAAGRFEGTLTIALQIASARNEIALHAVGLDVTAATAELGDGRRLSAVRDGRRRQRDRDADLRRRAAGRRRQADARLRGGLQPRAARALPGRPAGRHPVRGGRRPPRLPLLRRAGVQGDLAGRRGGRSDRRGRAVERRRPSRRERRARRTAGHLRADAAALVVPHRAHRRPDRAERRRPRPRHPDLHLDHRREAPPDLVRPGDGLGRPAAARGLLRPPLPVRQARSDRRPRLRGGRDGERGRRHLPRGGAAGRSRRPRRWRCRSGSPR